MLPNFSVTRKNPKFALRNLNRLGFWLWPPVADGARSSLKTNR